MPADLDDQRYARTCFVMMPYGSRSIGSATVDFDRVYEDILKPAIGRVKVDGKAMIAKRADKSVGSRILILGMIQDLLKSRLAIAEITVQNDNVSWELGMRQGSVPSGTVLLWLQRRSKRRGIPFDLAWVSVSEYADTPSGAIEPSIRSIAATLRATLRNDEVDSPAFLGARRLVDLIGAPEAPTRFGAALAEAELAELEGRPSDAASLYSEVVALAPDQPLLHQRRGVLYMQSGNPELARDSFQKVLEIDPVNLDARRYLADAREGRPFAFRPDARLSLPEGLVVKDGSLDTQHLLLAPDAPSDLMNVSIVSGDLGRGRYYSTVRVVGEPVQNLSAVEAVCHRHGFDSRLGAMDVPEANRTIHAFGATSPDRSALASTLDELQKDLSNLPGIGRIEVGRKFGGGFGSG